MGWSKRAMELHEWVRQPFVAELQMLHRTLVRHMISLDPRSAHFKAVQALNFEVGKALKVIEPTAQFGIPPHSTGPMGPNE